MNIRGILFDKDGTLIEFEAMWLSITNKVIDDLFKEFSISTLLKYNFLETIGVYENKIQGDSILAMKTSNDVALAWHKLMLENKIYYEFEEIKNYVKDKFNFYSTSGEADIRPIRGVIELLDYLKKQNIALGIATADTRESTENSLKKAGIYNYFDYIGSDDGITSKKPNSFMAEKFCKDFSINKEELLIVGDTICDMEFAENVGCNYYGVLSGVGSRAELNKYTENIINSVNDLKGLLK